MVVVVGASVPDVDGAVAVVVGADDGSAMVGTSSDASCVSGAWEADTRNSPPTRSMIPAAGLVRGGCQRRFMRIRPSRCCDEQFLASCSTRGFPTPSRGQDPLSGNAGFAGGAPPRFRLGSAPAVTLLVRPEQGESWDAGVGGGGRGAAGRRAA